MPAAPTDFFHYILPTATAAHWGITVTGGGVFHARAGDPYPPAGHPSDHYFNWRNGRVLGAFQIVYIAQGAGEFETQATGRVSVATGTALLLFPGVWHRYRPESATGWTEKWIELSGPIPGRLTRAKVFTPMGAVTAVTRPVDCEARFDAIHKLLLTQPAGFESELSTHALGVLSLLRQGQPGRVEDKPVAVAVAKAKHWMEDGSNETLSIPELAEKLGVAYSYFRREFRQRTGFSPQQYQLRMRLQRAQRLLGSTDQSIKQIADRLGFSSPYHLSTAFKAQFGSSPAHWRQQRVQPVASGAGS